MKGPSDRSKDGGKTLPMDRGRKRIKINENGEREREKTTKHEAEKCLREGRRDEGEDLATREGESEGKA